VHRPYWKNPNPYAGGKVGLRHDMTDRMSSLVYNDRVFRGCRYDAIAIYGGRG